jgi:hypothetical protein
MALFGELHHPYTAERLSTNELANQFLEAGAPPLLIQQIFDSGTNGFVYYTTRVVDLAPSASITFPTYTGTLNTATHAIIQIIRSS